jgi:hypothetical protein
MMIKSKEWCTAYYKNTNISNNNMQEVKYYNAYPYKVHKCFWE